MKYLISKKLLYIFIIAILITSCSLNKKTTTIQKDYKEKNVIEEALKNKFNENDSLYIISNEENNLILYVSEKKETDLVPANSINFFVYDNVYNKIIYENKYDNASIKWYNNNQLLLVRKLGIIDKHTGMNIKHYIIDIDSKKITERMLQPKNNK